MTHALKRSGLLLAALLLALAGCSSDEGGRDGETGDHNDADVAFATEMIQHHAQALQMVDLTMGRDLDPEVATLAEEIRAAQTPEIETLADWLQEWGEEVPATSRDHANAHGEGEQPDSDMPGMMSHEEMQALEDASDAEFEDMWLEMMIEHHEGAVTMAQTVQADGAHDGAIEMAEGIESGQTAEIETMQDLLSS